MYYILWKICLSNCILISACSRWFKDSRLLTDQEKYQTFSELRSGVLVLIIKNLTERDLGHYDCEVGTILTLYLNHIPNVLLEYEKNDFQSCLFALKPQDVTLMS